MLDAYTAWKAYGYYKTWRDVLTSWRRIRGVTWRKGDRLCVDWLRVELGRLGFASREEQTEDYLAHCMFSLNTHGMFWQGQVREFFADATTMAELKGIYE